jgi:hypothetical protein
MANLKLSPVIELRSGKHAGQCIQLFKQGTSIKNKNNPRYFRSINQNFFRNYLMQAVREWHLLSDGSRTNWINWAASFPQQTKRNSEKFLTGYQLFVKRNYYLYLCFPIDFHFMTNPVSVLYALDPVTTLVMLKDDRLIIRFTFSLNSDKFDVIFSCSSTESSGMEFFSSQYRIIQVLSNLSQDIDVTDNYLQIGRAHV